MQANFLFRGSDYLKTSRAWIMHLSCAIPSTELYKFDWAQVTWISPLSSSLNFFAEALVMGFDGNLNRIWICLTHVFVTVLPSISSPFLRFLAIMSSNMLFVLVQFLINHEMTKILLKYMKYLNYNKTHTIKV